MMSKTKEISLEEAREMVRRLRSISEESPEKLKDLVMTCNSLCILLFHYKLPQDASYFLEIAFNADKKAVLKTWECRLLTHLNLAYFYFRQDNYQNSLKCLYTIHQISLNLKERTSSVSSDFILVSSMLTFMVLWKIKEIKEAKKYLDIATGLLQSLKIDNSKSRFSINILRILSILQILGEAAFAVTIDKTVEKARHICQEALNTISSEIQTRALLQKFIDNQDFSLTFDWLITTDYEKSILVNCFLPFVSPSTPVLRKRTLWGFQSKGKLMKSERESENMHEIFKKRRESGLFNRRIRVNSTLRDSIKTPESYNSRTRSVGRPIQNRINYYSPETNSIAYEHRRKRSTELSSIYSKRITIKMSRRL